MVRHAIGWLILLLLVPVLTADGSRPGTIRTVVIDAGHGGKDPGALGRQAREKTINLAIALKLGRMIREGNPGVKVIYTRDDDRFVELYRRAAIANEARADLFISIHCNSNRNPSLRGAETYIMGLHRSEANLSTAKTENAAILLESGYQDTYEGFNPNSDESYIIFSLNQNANLDRSTDLAAAIQAQMADGVGLNNRGVRQAGFLVLYKTTMPSVLVEAGYLSHPEEEKFLMTEKGQDHIARAIFRAFSEIAGEKGAEEAKAGDQRTEGVQRLSWRVQVAAEAKPLKAGSPRISGYGKVDMYRHGGMYKYTVGDEPDLTSVLRLLEEVRKKGARDAFVVIFRNGERIPQPEADRLMKQ